MGAHVHDFRKYTEICITKVSEKVLESAQKTAFMKFFFS